MNTPDLSQVIPYILSALAPVLAQYLGWLKLPNGPLSEPKADPEATAFLDWTLKVKSGSVKLDDKDKEILKLIKASLADMKE